jgi:hypothetical protein
MMRLSRRPVVKSISCLTLASYLFSLQFLMPLSSAFAQTGVDEVKRQDNCSALLGQILHGAAKESSRLDIARKIGFSASGLGAAIMASGGMTAIREQRAAAKLYKSIMTKAAKDASLPVLADAMAAFSRSAEGKILQHFTKGSAIDLMGSTLSVRMKSASTIAEIAAITGEIGPSEIQALKAMNSELSALNGKVPQGMRSVELETQLRKLEQTYQALENLERNASHLGAKDLRRAVQESMAPVLETVGTLDGWTHAMNKQLHSGVDIYELGDDAARAHDVALKRSEGHELITALRNSERELAVIKRGSNAFAKKLTSRVASAGGTLAGMTVDVAEKIAKSAGWKLAARGAVVAIGSIVAAANIFDLALLVEGDNSPSPGQKAMKDPGAFLELITKNPKEFCDKHYYRHHEGQSADAKGFWEKTFLPEFLKGIRRSVDSEIQDETDRAVAYLEDPLNRKRAIAPSDRAVSTSNQKPILVDPNARPTGGSEKLLKNSAGSLTH